MNHLSNYIDEIEELGRASEAGRPERLREIARALAGLWPRMPGGDQAYSLLRAGVLLAPDLDDDECPAVAQRCGEIPRECGEELATDLSAFRELAVRWESDCVELPDFGCPAQPIQEAMGVYLEDLRLLGRAARGAERLSKYNADLQWLSKLLQELAARASAALEASPVRNRLWPLLPEAHALGFGDLVPSLRELLETEGARIGAHDRGLSTTKSPGRLDQGRAVRVADQLARRDERFRSSVVWAAVRGRLGEDDMALVKCLVSKDPARWGGAHRHALHTDGFPAVVYMERSGAVWTAPAALRVSDVAVRPQLRLGEAAARQAVPLPVTDVDPSRSGLPASADPDVCVLTKARLEMARVDLHVYGDEQGLWCLAVRGGGGRKVRCAFTKEEATGWHAQIPLLQTGPAGFPQRSFRPGPLRGLLADQDFPLVDRAYSTRAFVITIGESSLRNIFGWQLRECAARLHRVARDAGIDSGASLLALLSREDALGVPWVAAVPTSGAGPVRRGLTTLGEVIRAIADMQAEELSAEIATVEALAGDLQPADGDEFVLIPTRTGTSLLATHIVRWRLSAKFPGSPIRVAPCDAMTQRRDLGEDRYDLSAEPLDAAYATADSEVGRLLVDEAADPVLVVSGGAKWESAAMLDLGADRRLPVAYRARRGRPLVFRWDWMPAGPRRLQGDTSTRDVSSSRYLVLTVGIGLLERFNAATPGAQEHAPSEEALLAWAESRGEPIWSLCAELTGVEAWWRTTGRGGEGDVVLISTHSEEGRLCAAVVKTLLEQRGARVHMADEWNIMDMRDVRDESSEEQMMRLRAELIRPITRCLDEVTRVAEAPDVLAMGGQKLAASVLQLVGRARGCHVYFVPEPEGGQPPALWRVSAAEKRPRLEMEYANDLTGYMGVA